MYITVSTGVGGGWILNGRPWRGAEGMAGKSYGCRPSWTTLLVWCEGERLASGHRPTVTRVFTAPERGKVVYSVGDNPAITGQIVSQAAT